MRRPVTLLATLLVLCGAGCTVEVSSGPSSPTAATAPPSTVTTQAPSTTVATAAATTTTGPQVLLAPPACITEATGQLEGDACLTLIPTFTDPIPQP